MIYTQTNLLHTVSQVEVCPAFQVDDNVYERCGRFEKVAKGWQLLLMQIRFCSWQIIFRAKAGTALVCNCKT